MRRWLQMAVLALCAARGAAPCAQAAEIVRYGFEGDTTACSNLISGLNASVFTYTGDGTTNFVTGYPSGGSSFRSTKWPTSATLDDYFGFTVSCPGFLVSIDSLAFAHQYSGEGPNGWVVRYSTDNTTFTTLDTGYYAFGSNTWHVEVANAVHPIDLTGTLYFRLYATNAATGSGTWRVDDVVLNGSVDVDTGRRAIRAQSFEGASWDNWGQTTNAGVGGTIAVTTNTAASGEHSLALTGSASQDADPNVVFENVLPAGLLTNVLGAAEPVTVTLGFAALNVDTDDDLHLDLSYDAGATWTGAGGVKLVDGFLNGDVAFGTTNSNPATVAANPYTVTTPLSATQVAVRVRFDESVNLNTADHYYVDDVQLRAVPVPATNAPSTSTYGGIVSVTNTQGTLRAHVRGGYPYPTIRVYYGTHDGGTNASEWLGYRQLGTNRWGLLSTTLTNLMQGQRYYFRTFASNQYGTAWAPAASNFVTTTTFTPSTRALYLDSIGFATVMPVAVDRDGNGLSDRWEVEHLGGTGNSLSGDADNDGVSNEREFIAGTDPDASNSMMRVVSLDLASETSTNIVVTWSGGADNGPATYATVGDRPVRTFRLVAANNAITNSRTAQAAVTDGLTGTNSWTDYGAASRYSARFYHLAVSYAGSGYTNTEEWAMFAQNRNPSQSFLISVPINYGSNSANNVSGMLGQHLARGLHPGSTTSPELGDKVQILQPGTNIWHQFDLVSNLSGQVYWYDQSLGGTASLHVTPGMGLWVVRSAGAVQRTNTVFTGRPWTDGAVSAISVTTNDGGWNILGWPLPTPRGQRNLGTSTTAAPLGFEALASGGVSNSASTNLLAIYKGDEIWVWANNEWQTYYWLMDHIGPTRNLRWWDRFKNDYADFALEPGRAYYYKHITNFWGGTNFTFTPTTP